MRDVQLFHAVRRLSDHLEEAMCSRATIEQAKGALMATYAVDADGAFDLLRRQSPHDNVMLRVVAEAIVEQVATGRPARIRIRPEV